MAAKPKLEIIDRARAAELVAERREKGDSGEGAFVRACAAMVGGRVTQLATEGPALVIFVENEGTTMRLKIDSIENADLAFR